MVMKLHTGVPGSGKTYLLVKAFIDLFCTWDKETERFILKKEHKDKILVSNIEGLTLPHLDIETLMNERCMQLARTRFTNNVGKYTVEDIKRIKDEAFKNFLQGEYDMQDVIDEYYYQFLAEKVISFFNYSYQKQLADKHGPIIYLIEESQRYFDSKELGRHKSVRDVLFFFEKHRHFGHSIFCDTQHHSKLHKGLVVLFETETRAKPRTLSVIGEFKYNEFADGAKINQVPIVVKPDQRIYKSYKSMSHKEDVKTKKPALKILVFVAFMICVSLFILNYARNNLGPDRVEASPRTAVPISSTPTHQPIQEISPPARPRGTWVHLPHTYSSKGFTVVHPITNAIMPLKEMDLEVKRQGTQFYCFIEEDPNGR